MYGHKEHKISPLSIKQYKCGEVNILCNTFRDIVVSSVLMNFIVKVFKEITKNSYW